MRQFLRQLWLTVSIIAVSIAARAEAPASPDERPVEPAYAAMADTLAADKSVYLDTELLVKAPGEEAHPGQLAADSIAPAAAADEPLNVVTSKDYELTLKREFNPDPTRAGWMSALFPGLGQIYNRRYWKLPIIVAGYMGLAYGTSWNARMYQDYQLAYADIMDDDPDTKSYLDFFPPTVDESSLDMTWLSQTLKSRKDYYRRNRDLCIIACVGVYLLCMLDAYVDASLSHFDISDDISMDVAPAVIINPGYRRPTLGLNWAFTF